MQGYNRRVKTRERPFMSVEFVPVKTDEEIAHVAKMADEIWHEYWPAIIGKAQTDYMVENFQSLEAFQRDIAESGYEYWFICEGEDDTPAELGNDPQTFAHDRIVGYTGGHAEEDGRFFISKIYLLKEHRGKGLCSETIHFYERLCRDRGLSAMYLTVNKHNELGIRAYKAKGFETIDAVETDIGNDFIMDDYIMEKKVS